MVTILPAGFHLHDMATKALLPRRRLAQVRRMRAEKPYVSSEVVAEGAARIQTYHDSSLQSREDSKLFKAKHLCRFQFTNHRFQCKPI